MRKESLFFHAKQEENSMALTPTERVAPNFKLTLNICIKNAERENWGQCKILTGIKRERMAEGTGYSLKFSYHCH